MTITLSAGCTLKDFTCWSSRYKDNGDRPQGYVLLEHRQNEADEREQDANHLAEPLRIKSHIAVLLEQHIGSNARQR